MATISNIQIANAIFEGSQGKTAHELSNFSKSVTEFLARKRLISNAPDILRKLELIVDSKEGVVRAHVKSATHLKGEAKKDIEHFIKKRYNAKDVILSEVVDEGLLGGMRIEVGDEVIDLTLKEKIEKLKEHLIKTR